MTDAEYRVLEGWGRRPRSAATVVRPAGADDLRDAAGPLAGGGRGVLARGLGRAYGDAALNGGGVVLDMTALQRIRRFDPAEGSITVDAGLSLAALIRAVLPFGWFVPVSPGTRLVTVGGAIAADIHGKNHHVDGGFSDHVTALTLWTPAAGTLEVTPEGSPEVFRATAGGMGLTGVITRATLRLLPVATSRMLVDTERARDLDDLMDRMERRDAEYRYSVAWVDLLARGAAMGRGVLTRGDHAGLDDLPAEERADPLALAMTTRLGVPDLVPSGLLGRASVRAFNEAWFRRAPRERLGGVERLDAFFHPLDVARAWNRLYGQRGFLQYQFVVPLAAHETLREVVRRLSAARVASFLAVLKRFGQGHGYLSFPIPGWTLALDIPLGSDGLGPLLDDLDQLVIAAGGRVYLAKDSRLRPESVRAMYPELGAWLEVRDRLDPDGTFQSDLSRRLALHSSKEA